VPCGALGPQFHAIEYRRGGERIIGEIEIQLLSPGMIMDRDGVLTEIVETTLAKVAGARSRPMPITLESGEGWCATASVGPAVGPYPYITVMALGYPDLMVPAALLVVMRAINDPWDGGRAIVESLELV
jgi:hypothetical protein